MNTGINQWREDVYLHEERISCYGITINRRMTVIRLADGRLWIHSPNQLTGKVENELNEIGQVAFIVTPNKMHQRALDEYREKYPSARLFLPSGFPEMRPDLAYDDILGDSAPAEWANEISQKPLRGNSFLTEVVFFHHASHALILTDLIENLGRKHTTAFGSFLLRLMKGYDRPVPAPEHRMFTLSWKQFSESIAHLEQWPFNAIILAHGALIELNTREVLCRVADSIIAKAKSRTPLTRWVLGAVSRFQCLPYMRRSIHKRTGNDK
jgi:hypothetical protein